MCKTYDDAVKLAKLKPKRVCVIGAGFIGMEMAWAYQEIGTNVTIIDHGERILSKYFDQECTDVLTEECHNLSMDIVSRARVISISEQLTNVFLIVE